VCFFLLRKKKTIFINVPTHGIVFANKDVTKLLRIEVRLHISLAKWGMNYEQALSSILMMKNFLSDIFFITFNF
jgi:hypothetical protein